MPFHKSYFQFVFWRYRNMSKPVFTNHLGVRIEPVIYLVNRVFWFNRFDERIFLYRFPLWTVETFLFRFRFENRFRFRFRFSFRLISICCWRNGLLLRFRFFLWFFRFGLRFNWGSNAPTLIKCFQKNLTKELIAFG